jgi:hypothetical protein
MFNKDLDSSMNSSRSMEESSDEETPVKLPQTGFKHEPYKLEFFPKTKAFKAKVKTQSSEGTLSSAREQQNGILPFYHLFRDESIHQILCEELLQLLNTIPQENVEPPTDAKESKRGQSLTKSKVQTYHQSSIQNSKSKQSKK